MSDTSIKKGVILNGQELIAVFKENDLVYRAAEIESYTPIVFRNLKANVKHVFNLGTSLDKSYQIADMAFDVVDDDNFLDVSEVQAANSQYVGASFAIVEQGKRVAWAYIQLYSFGSYPNNLILQPSQTLCIVPNYDLHHLTLYCQPVYLENTIVVPEVMPNDSSN